MRRSTITLSRQFGSHGDTVAHLLCERLDFRYFDKQLMTGLAVQSGIPWRVAVRLPDEQKQARSLVERLFTSYSLPFGDPISWAAASEAVARDQLAKTRLTHLIEAAHARGRVVIIGRGGQAVLRGKPGVLHVRLIAPLELRIARHMRRAGLGEEEARRQVLQRDQASCDYVGRFYELDPADPSLYDLVINTAKLTPSDAADLIIAGLGA